MAKRPKNKMTPEERAKQFSPFSALSGLDLALLKKEKEKLLVARKLTADDKAEEISRRLLELTVGDKTEITFYKRGEYVKARGEVKKIDADMRILTIGKTAVSFSDIYEIAEK